MATVVLGVIGSDSHVVGITILEHALQNAGFTVNNIGVQATQQDFINAADTHNADAILVSSLYGHAEQDCEGFHNQLELASVDTVTYIGGNLSVGQIPFKETRTIFEQLGFDRVFDSQTNAEEAISALKEDLDLQESTAERVQVSTNS